MAAGSSCGWCIAFSFLFLTASLSLIFSPCMGTYPCTLCLRGTTGSIRVNERRLSLLDSAIQYLLSSFSSFPNSWIHQTRSQDLFPSVPHRFPLPQKPKVPIFKHPLLSHDPHTSTPSTSSDKVRLILQFGRRRLCGPWD